MVRNLRRMERCFNPRSYERSDDKAALIDVLIIRFNPRSYERSDGGNCMATPNGICFNPRSYERSDTAKRLTV